MAIIRALLDVPCKHEVVGGCWGSRECRLHCYQLFVTNWQIAGPIYTPVKPDETAIPSKTTQNNQKLVQMADHALLMSRTAVGTKEFPLLLVLCASDLNQRPLGKRSNITYRACSGSFKIDSNVCKICWSQNKDKVLNWSQIIFVLIFTILCSELFLARR